MSLDEIVEAWRSRPLDKAPYTFVWIDALTQKVREGGRIVNIAVLVATGVNAEGYREILAIDIGSAEDGATLTSFLRGLVARGLSGVKLVTSDCHLAGLGPQPACLRSICVLGFQDSLRAGRHPVRVADHSPAPTSIR